MSQCVVGCNVVNYHLRVPYDFCIVIEKKVERKYHVFVADSQSLPYSSVSLASGKYVSSCVTLN